MQFKQISQQQSLKNKNKSLSLERVCNEHIKCDDKVSECNVLLGPRSRECHM